MSIVEENLLLAFNYYLFLPFYFNALLILKTDGYLIVLYFFVMDQVEFYEVLFYLSFQEDHENLNTKLKILATDLRSKEMVANEAERKLQEKEKQFVIIQSDFDKVSIAKKCFFLSMLIIFANLLFKIYADIRYDLKYCIEKN